MSRMVVFILCLTGALAPTVAQQDETRTFKISKIEFVGLKMHEEKQALAASGLKIGQETDLNGVKAALARLLRSGMFRRGKYHYLFVDDQAELVFDLVEVRSSPCVFDNFVWFQPAEIANAIRQTFPTFDGTVPETDLVIVRVKGVLQKLLQEKNIAGQVEYIFSEGENEQGAHIFRVTSPAPLVCSLRFDGVQAGKENDLNKVAKPLLNADYSVFATKQFADLNLLPLYRRQGFLRVRFLEPNGQLETTGKCKNSVAVVIRVEEGAIFTWDKAAWSGNTALSIQVLEAALGLKSGEVANGEKIDLGLNAVLKAYLKQGYVAANIKPRVTFDDTSNRVGYEVAIEEGAQYKMGELTAPGLSESDAKKLLGNWKLNPGDIFDAVYFSEFLQKKNEDLKLRSQGKQVKGQLLPDKQKLTVDLSLSIRNF